MRYPWTILILGGMIVYLTLPARGWIFIIKSAFKLFIGALHFTKWLTVVALAWGIICSPHVYSIFGCTPLSVLAGTGGVYEDPNSPAYAFESQEDEKAHKKDTKRKRATRPANH